MSTGLQLLHSLVKEKSLGEYLKMGLQPDMFRASEQDVFELFEDHVRKFASMPAKSTFKKWMDGEGLPLADEVPAFYLDQLKKRNLADKLKKTNSLIKSELGQKADPEAAFEAVRQQVLEVQLYQQQAQIMDFRDSKDTFVRETKKHLMQGDDYGIQLGWATPDEMIGGIIPGDLISIVGRPAMGKTWLTLFAAHHAWYAQKKRVLLLSMEMGCIPLMQRTVALHTHIDAKQVKNANLSTKQFQRVVQEISDIENHPAPFWIVDGNLTATAHDLYYLVMQLKPDVVYIDGAYLLGHPDKRIQRNERINQNTEFLKKIVAGECGCPVVCTWQFNREVTKLKKGEEAGTENIAGTDAIGQLSSLVMGLFQKESVETTAARHIEILKGRGGETGGFDINWHFKRMDFQEHKEKSVEDLSYM